MILTYQKPVTNTRGAVFGVECLDELRPEDALLVLDKQMIISPENGRGDRDTYAVGLRSG